MKTLNDLSAGKLDLPSFAKIMIGDFDSRMKIPPAFLKHICGEYPRRFMLSGSARRFWAVHASKFGEKVYLEAGWKEFVQDNRLKEADFLIFHYRGDAIFQSPSGEGSRVTGLDKDHGEIIDVDSDGSSEEEGSDSDYDSSDNDYGRPSLFRRKRWNGNEMRLTKTAARVIASQNHTKDQLPDRHAENLYKEALLDVRKIGWRPSFLCFAQSIPVAMIGHLLGFEEEYIKLMVEDKTWGVKLNVYEESFKLGAGWPVFVKENDLKVGDVCNFEVTKRDGEVYLLVTIRRKDFCRFY